MRKILISQLLLGFGLFVSQINASGMTALEAEEQQLRFELKCKHNMFIQRSLEILKENTDPRAKAEKEQNQQLLKRAEVNEIKEQNRLRTASATDIESLIKEQIAQHNSQATPQPNTKLSEVTTIQTPKTTRTITIKQLDCLLQPNNSCGFYSLANSYILANENERKFLTHGEETQTCIAERLKDRQYVSRLLEIFFRKNVEFGSSVAHKLDLGKEKRFASFTDFLIGSCLKGGMEQPTVVDLLQRLKTHDLIFGWTSKDEISYILENAALFSHLPIEIKDSTTGEEYKTIAQLIMDFHNQACPLKIIICPLSSRHWGTIKLERERVTGNTIVSIVDSLRYGRVWGITEKIKELRSALAAEQ